MRSFTLLYTLVATILSTVKNLQAFTSRMLPAYPMVCEASCFYHCISLTRSMETRFDE
jgi:hypothetical protein